MTNEEAIKVLRTESVEIGDNAVSVCRFFEAVDMAVTALLEQQYVIITSNRTLTNDELAMLNALRSGDKNYGVGNWC